MTTAIPAGPNARQMELSTGAVGAAGAASLLAAGLLGGLAAPPPLADGAHGAAGASGAGGAAAAAVLGGARALVLDVLWLRAGARRAEGRTLELPALLRTIAALSPRIERVWEFHADTLALNLPLAASGDPERGARHVVEGLQLLLEGLRWNPGSERLRRALAHHLLAAGRPGRAPLVSVRISEAFGREPLAWAQALLREAASGPAHEPVTDVWWAVALRRTVERGGEEGARARVALERLLDHIRSAHPETHAAFFAEEPGEDRGR